MGEGIYAMCELDILDQTLELIFKEDSETTLSLFSCRTDNEKKYIIPANFSEAVGFDLEMAPAEDEVPDVAWMWVNFFKFYYYF